METKNTKYPSTSSTHDMISQENTFHEPHTDEINAKTILSKLLNFIPLLNQLDWSKIFDDLNKGIVGKNINEKDCYRVGFIERLKKYAKSQNCLFAKDGNKLYIYNDQYWIKLSEDLIKNFLHKAAKKMGIPTGHSYCVKFIKNVYEQLFESGFYEKMVQNNITYLNLLNGTLKIDIYGIELVGFNPKHFLTHQLDFKYNTTSINQKWLDFLNIIIPDKDTQKTLQQALGYLFIRNLKLEQVIFLFGIGSNGKSVIFEILKGLLDPNMITNYSLVHLTNKLGYQVADLHNKLINYGSDISMKNIDAAVFKQLASGEPIGTRQIRNKAFTMTNYAKLIFNVNKIDDADIENTHGFFRRMTYIPFEVIITKEQQDKKLHKKLLKNKAGIMNWLVEGMNEVIANEEIYLSRKCENFLENFKKESSPIQLFIEDSNLEKISEVSGLTIDFQQMYEMYREFCKKQGERAVPQRTLNADLKRLGFKRKRRKQGNVWFAKTN